MDLNYYDYLWSKNRYTGGPTAQENELYWDKMADFMNKWKENRKKRKAQNMISFLQHKNMLEPDFSVLDIGCGLGEHTKLFAGIVKDVIGTDISGKMILNAQNNINIEGITNAAFVKTDWDTADLDELGWSGKFDLVFASMTPAIGNKATLEKMIKASKKYCFSAYPVSMKSHISDKMSKDMGLNINNKHNTFITVYCLVNTLFLLGYYPEVHYEDQRWESVFSLDTAIEHFNKQLCNSQNKLSMEEDVLRKYLEQYLVDDSLTEIIETKTAWISWKV